MRRAYWVVFFAALILAHPHRAAAASIVYTANFDAGAPAEFSGITTTAPVAGYAGVSDFAGQMLWNSAAGTPTAPATTLTLAGLAPHAFVNLDFRFAAVDSWDGSTPFAGTVPPDFFNVRVDGISVFSHTFDNFDQTDGTYTGPSLTFGTNLFNNPGWPDSAYNLVLSNIPHVSGSLVIDWFASGIGWQAGSDESWGMDNLTVSISDVPEPASLVLLGIGLVAVSARRRRLTTNAS